MFRNAAFIVVRHSILSPISLSLQTIPRALARLTSHQFRARFGTGEYVLKPCCCHLQAFIKLESLESLSEDQKKAYEELALEIFTK